MAYGKVLFENLELFISYLYLMLQLKGHIVGILPAI